MRVFPIVVFVMVAACNKEITTGPAAAERQITVGSTEFTPNEVIIRQGGKVTFLFENVPHSVIFDDKEGRPENMEIALSNTTEQRIFDTVGAFIFRCKEHQSMLGTVNVQAVPVAGP